MKKHKLLTVILLAALFVTSIVFASCGGNKIDYTVKVQYPSGDAAESVTVQLVKDGKVVSSAKTDGDGIAKMQAKADKYQVNVVDIPSGYGFYEEVITNTLGTEMTVSLSHKKIVYTANVRNSDGTAMEGATVIWTDSAGQKFEATTDSNGVATKELVVGTYSVTVIAQDYYLPQAVTTTESNQTAELTLEADNREEYKISVTTEGGLHYPNIKVSARKNGEEVVSGLTDSKGIAVLKMEPDNYDIVALIPDGYTTAEEKYIVTDKIRSVDIVISSALLPAETLASTSQYVLGSIMHDFTVTTYDGKTVNLATLLQTKKAVILNLWYQGCYWCGYEFPALWKVYQQYSDTVEVVAIDPYPDDFTMTNNANPDDVREMVETFRMQCGISDATFPMGMDNAPMGNDNSIAGKFAISGFPATVVIDRYGAVAFFECGALSEAAWQMIFSQYSDENYVQNFVPGEITTPEPPTEIVKPNIEMPDSSVLEQAINNTESGFNFSYRPETEATDKEYSWPWLASEYDGRGVIVPSNKKIDNSFATVHTDVTLKAGQVVAFDFFSSTEQEDILFVSVDGLVQFQIAGISQNWQTCYAYVAERDGTYDISLLYYKNSLYYGGDDVVYISNMRIASIDDIDAPTELMRDCVWNRDGDSGYLNHITPVMADDGYYHVNSADGPYLFFDLLHITPWSGNSLLGYVYDEENDFCTFDFDNDGKEEDCKEILDEYLSLSLISDYYGMIPIDERCYRAFTLLMEEVAVKTEHRHLRENEWLEACRYVSRYGTDEPMVNPILGLTETAATSVSEGLNTVSLHKYLGPNNSLIYKFVPTRSGVFKFYSVGDEYTQIFLYDERGIEKGIINSCTDDVLTKDIEADTNNFEMYAYLVEGVTYYIKAGFYYSDVIGQFDYHIKYVGEEFSVLEHATASVYTTTLGEDGGFGGEIIIISHVSVVLKKDDKFYTLNNDGTLTRTNAEFTGEAENGKYYAVNSDNSLTPILVSFKKGSYAHEWPLTKIIETYILDLKVYPTENNYRMFDFTVEFARDQNGDIIYDENGHVTVVSSDGQDYTARMREIADTADENGFVQANEELVEILKLYAIRDQFGADNAWLMFCRYMHKYSASDVA